MWDIIARKDVPRLRKFLMAHRDRFTHHGKPTSEHTISDPIHDQMFFLTEVECEELAKECDVYTWRLEQHVDEAVFVPAGCPHQVRNLRSCIKVGLK